MTPKQLAARNKKLEENAKDPGYFLRDTSSPYYKAKRDKRLKDIDPFEDHRY